MDSNPTTTQSCTKGGCLIRLHLQEGNPQGKIEAKLDNWVGEILRSGRGDLEWLLKHERAQKPGIYFLQGNDPSPVDDDRKKVYIGLSNRNLQSRLRAHAKDEDMDFWETACLITASDVDTMNHNNCHYLEAMLIKQAIDAKRASIFNTQKPSLNLSPMDKQEPDNFIRNLKLVLPVINMNFLNPLRATDKSIKDFMFEIFHQSSGVRAKANEINGDFFVLKGSQSATKGRKESGHRKKRQTLIDKGDLKQIGDSTTYEFTKDVRFSSPSAAASIVIDGQASPREWKINGAKKLENYNDWRENPSKFSFS